METASFPGKLSPLDAGELPTTIAGAQVVVAAGPLEPPATGGPAVRLEEHGCGSALTVDTVARFEIDPDGAVVRVVPDMPGHIDLVRGWLHGSVAALVLAHSGRLALHATTVDVAGCGVAVGGRSGAGKSTTSLRLAQRGYAIVADDVSPVALKGGLGTQAIVTPLGRPLHVWPDTADRLGLDVSAARPCFPGTDKLQLPAPDADQPIGLQQVVLLEAGDVPEPQIRRLRGADAILAIARNVYRPELVRTRWQPELMMWAAAVARAVPVHRLIRPWEGWTVDSVAAELETLVSGTLPGTASGGPGTRRTPPAQRPAPRSVAQAAPFGSAPAGWPT